MWCPLINKTRRKHLESDRQDDIIRRKNGCSEYLGPSPLLPALWIENPLSTSTRFTIGAWLEEDLIIGTATQFSQILRQRFTFCLRSLSNRNTPFVGHLGAIWLPIKDDSVSIIDMSG